MLSHRMWGVIKPIHLMSMSTLLDKPGIDNQVEGNQIINIVLGQLVRMEESRIEDFSVNLTILMSF